MKRTGRGHTRYTDEELTWDCNADHRACVREVLRELGDKRGLLAVARRVRPVLGLGSRGRSLFVEVLSFIARDNLEAGVAVVTMPKYRIAHELGIGRHTLSRALRDFAEAGLVVRSSPSGRGGVERHSDGTVQDAMGVDFTPFLLKLGELQGEALSRDDQFIQARVVRREITTLRGKCDALLQKVKATIQCVGLDTICERLSCLSAACMSEDVLSELRAIYERLRDYLADVIGTELSQCDDKSAGTTTGHDQKDSVHPRHAVTWDDIRTRLSCFRDVAEHAQNIEGVADPWQMTQMARSLAIDSLCIPNWLVQQADDVCKSRMRSTLLLVLVAERARRGQIRQNAAAYLVGCLKRERAGGLDLERSLRALPAEVPT